MGHVELHIAPSFLNRLENWHPIISMYDRVLTLEIPQIRKVTRKNEKSLELLADEHLLVYFSEEGNVLRAGTRCWQNFPDLNDL